MPRPPAPGSTDLRPPSPRQTLQARAEPLQPRPPATPERAREQDDRMQSWIREAEENARVSREGGRMPSDEIQDTIIDNIARDLAGPNPTRAQFEAARREAEQFILRTR